MVITDRLGKGVMCKALRTTTTESVARAFIRTFYRQHGLPVAIVSDRGTQFVSLIWKRICQLLGIVRRLSTAFHPQTDGATERMNQEVEKYLRTFTTYAQDDWDEQLPAAELAINNRDSASTQTSPFFLQHGYHVSPLQVHKELHAVRDAKTPVQKADAIVRKLQETVQWAQATIAVAQQKQEEHADRYRTEGISYRVGDKVWLNLRNVRTTRPSKKLD